MVAFASVVVLTDTKSATSIDNTFVADCTVALESVIPTVKLPEVDATAGVPLITPDEGSSTKPPGSEPATTDHAYVGVPPDACSVWL
ncbi:unannotated protein [freshwater metagenome]|uniref:Unannotated protein n=1 Tax=freshwater metagenome TaxID=449393 RepID=A0A6J7NKV0_9ZZZZ